MSRLALTIVVRHPETAMPVALIEGSELPEWAEDLVDRGNLTEDAPDAEVPAKSK